MLHQVIVKMISTGIYETEEEGTRHFGFGYCELLTQVVILLRGHWLTFFLQSRLWLAVLQRMSLKCFFVLIVSLTLKLRFG